MIPSFRALFIRRPRSPHRPAGRLQVEQLEDRSLLSASFRTFDGTGNNLLHPLLGSAGTQLLRIAPADYGDGVSTPAGADRPSARVISNTVMAETREVLNERLLSDFVYVFGQFVDHDLDLTGNASPAEAFNIPVPQGDPYFDPSGTGTRVIGMNRSAYDPATRRSSGNPRQQVNIVTAWLDGSGVYGSDSVRAAALRTFVGGRLKTSEGDLLPFNTLGLENQNRSPLPPEQLFLAGDIRVNENIELTAIQTLFLREHNRVAGRIAAANPHLRDEQIYQRARQWVGAEIQVIAYNEFLPALLGPGALRPYSGYKPWVNPGIANEFAHAGFRVGHTFLGDDVEFLDNEGAEIREEVPLSAAFFNPALVQQTGIDPILKYLSADKAREGDLVLVNSVRNFLFGPPGAGGFDLAALDIQRARDHGLADYNSARAAYGLPRVRSFAQITGDRALQAALRDLYGSVNNIDLFVGGLAESHAPGASVGPLFQRIIADQFTRLRDGDRFWYQRLFSGRELAELERTTLADVIRRHTTITNIQDDAFFFRVTISGRVFLDRDGDGRRERGEPGLGGRLVQLLNDEGAVIATALTRLDGGYRFTGRDGLDSPGLYRVRIVPRPGEALTTANPAEVRITRGMTVAGIDYGISRVPGSGLGAEVDVLLALAGDVVAGDFDLER
ncbi:MAG: peroxidase [Gemmataceae bacterium]|nr:peroxidase [Gemmataceae bacterium]